MHVTNESTDVNSNAVITGHNSNNTNRQLWYLGNTSSGNEDIAFINRRNGALIFQTNAIERARFTASGSFGIGRSPCTLFEVAGTASASRFFSVGELQIAGTSAATVSYSRFGVGITGHSLTAADDLLISGLIEFDDNAFFDATVTLGTMSIGSGVTWTTTGTLTVGDGGDRIDFSTSGWDIANSIMTGMTISTNNVTGTWTTTGALTIGDNGDDIIIDSNDWDVDSAGVFSGLTGLTSSGAVILTGSIDIPSGAGCTTVDAAGELCVNSTTASASLNFNDGTVERVLKAEICRTFSTDALTATDQWGGVRLFDSVTITKFGTVASGTGAVGIRLLHGDPGTVTTSLFTEIKSASAASAPIYTSGFNDATIEGNEVIDFAIASASADLSELGVTFCYTFDAPA